MTLITNKARAYVNFGRWIADCPMDCGSALALQGGQGMFHCPECNYMAEVEWPNNADAIWQQLMHRPAKRNRNWFPSNHQLALRSGSPHGQSPAELAEETEENRQW